MIVGMEGLYVYDRWFREKGEAGGEEPIIPFFLLGMMWFVVVARCFVIATRHAT